MIGKILADYRYANRISQRELAKQIGVSCATICRIEKGLPMEQSTIVTLFNILFGKILLTTTGRRQKGQVN